MTLTTPTLLSAQPPSDPFAFQMLTGGRQHVPGQIRDDHSGNVLCQRFCHVPSTCGDVEANPVRERIDGMHEVLKHCRVPVRAAVDVLLRSLGELLLDQLLALCHTNSTFRLFCLHDTARPRCRRIGSLGIRIDICNGPPSEGNPTART
jgi:hypothetical protein